VKRLLVAALCGVAMIASAQAPSFADQAPTYEQMMREPAKLKGTNACWTGTVSQVQDGDKYSVLLVNMGRTVDDSIIVFSSKLPEPRIMENDVVEFCGEFLKLYTYESVGLGQVTAPEVYGRKVRRIGDTEARR
jgi:hypothetical protein